MARRVFIGGLIFFASVSFGVARAATTEVSISGNDYSPSTIRIQVGDTVEWTNAETGLLPTRKNSHTVTADNGSFDSGTLGPGQRFSLQFSTAGTYPYSCTIHPNMHGLVVVLAPRPSPTPTPTPKATVTQTARATPKTTPSRTTAASASPSPSPSPTDSVVASAIGGGGSSAGVIASVAIVAIAVLTLLGWFVYVRFIRET